MPPTSSTLPASNSGDVTVIRASGVPRSRTFASPFRKGRVAATAEGDVSREPDIMDELDALLGGAGEDDDLDFDLDGDEPQVPAKKAAPKRAAAKKAPAKKAPAKKAAPKAAAAASDDAVSLAAAGRAASPVVTRSVAPSAAPAAEPKAAPVAAQRTGAAAAASAAAHSSAAAPASRRTFLDVDAPAAPVAAEPVAAVAADPVDAAPVAPAEPTAVVQAAAQPAPVVEPAADAVAGLDAAQVGGLELSSAPAGAVVLTEKEIELHRRGADAVRWLAGRVGPAAEAALGEARRDLMRLSRSVLVHEGTMKDVKMHQLASALLLRHGFTLDKRQPGVRTAFSASVGPGTGPVALFALEAGAPGDADDHAGVAALVGGAIALSAIAPGLGVTVRFVGVPRGTSSLAALYEDGFLDGTTLVASAGRGQADEVPLGAEGGRTWEARFAAPTKLEATALPVLAEDAIALARTALGLLASRLPAGCSLGASLEDDVLNVRLQAGSASASAAVAERLEAALRGAAQASGAVLKLRETSGVGAQVQQDAVLAGAYRSTVELRGRDVEFSAAQPDAPLAELSEAFPTLHVTVGPGDGLPGGTDPGMLDAAYGLALSAAAGCLAGTAR